MLGSIGAVSYDIVSQDKTAEGLTSAGDRARQIGKVAGAAMTGIGVGMIALTDSAKKTNATIKQTALQLNITAGEMRELTLATTNVTFPIEEVTASFDLLTRAGMENKEEIAIAATAFDTLGDAIGLSASEVTKVMVPAFKAFKIPLSDASKYTDIFTHLTRNTTVELADFSSMLNYIAPDLDVLGLSMQDSAAIMEVLADKGIQGSAATREFRKAVSAAAAAPEKLMKANLKLSKATTELAKAQKEGKKDIEKYQKEFDEAKSAVDNLSDSEEEFYKILGITRDEVAKYSKEISDSTGITEEFADAANTQYGTMDKVKQSIGELTLKYGSMLEPLDALGPAMTALGPIMIMMSTIQWGTLIPALAAHATAAWAAIAPYLVIIAPIVAVIAILYVLEKKFGVVTKATEILTEGIKKLIDWFKNKLVVAFDKVKPILDKFGDKLLFLLGPIGAVIYAFKNWREILRTVKDAFNSVISYIGGLYSTFKDLGRNLIQWFIYGLTGTLWRIGYAIGTKLNELISYIGRWASSFNNLGRNLIQWLIYGFTGILWKIKYAIGEKLLETYNYVSNWFRSFYNLGKNLIQSMINGVVNKIWALKDEISNLLQWIYDRLPHSPVKMGPLVEEPDWESYLIKPMRTAKISPSVMFESGIGGGGGASAPTIEVNIEATIYNPPDVEEIERKIGEAAAKGIHDAYGMR